MTTPADAKLILRGKGLCGYLVHGTHVCILEVGHDNKIHEDDTYLTKLTEDELAAIGMVLQTNKDAGGVDVAWRALMKLMTHYQCIDQLRRLVERDTSEQIAEWLDEKGEDDLAGKVRSKHWMMEPPDRLSVPLSHAIQILERRDEPFDRAAIAEIRQLCARPASSDATVRAALREALDGWLLSAAATPRTDELGAIGHRIAELRKIADT